MRAARSATSTSSASVTLLSLSRPAGRRRHSSLREPPPQEERLAGQHVRVLRSLLLPRSLHQLGAAPSSPPGRDWRATRGKRPCRGPRRNRGRCRGPAHPRLAGAAASGDCRRWRPWPRRRAVALKRILRHDRGLDGGAHPGMVGGRIHLGRPVGRDLVVDLQQHRVSQRLRRQTPWSTAFKALHKAQASQLTCANRRTSSGRGRRPSRRRRRPRNGLVPAWRRLSRDLLLGGRLRRLIAPPPATI